MEVKTEFKDYEGSILTIEPYGNNMLLNFAYYDFIINKETANLIAAKLSQWFNIKQNKKITSLQTQLTEAKVECERLREEISKLQPFKIGDKVWFWHNDKQKALRYAIEYMDVLVRMHRITIAYKLVNGSAGATKYKVYATKEELLTALNNK
jgi:endonuclease I